MNYIIQLLAEIMDRCYLILKNYGWAVVLFTFISKLVLLPVSIWVQKNSIKMVKMQPEINAIKVKHFGDKDTIAEMQSQLYRKYKYNAFASVIPMVIQIALLIALISVIKNGLQISGVDSDFYGVQLGEIPIEKRGLYLLIPFIAGLAAYLLCFVQNKINVLQANSSNVEKYFTTVVSVGLSLYLGFYVQVGVIIYWIASNLFGILQIIVLNAVINPKKYIDYDRLEESRKKLSELESIEGKNSVSKEAKKKENADYKRFFAVVNKHVVFYSESNGFYKYFKDIIEYLLEHTNIIIHYITSDPNDNIFMLEKKNNRIRAYYIGEKKLITLMMKMDADIVCMTMPDLDNYHIKRSYLRKDIEYIFIPHGLGSMNLVMRKGCVDNFDTVFCAIETHKREILKTEEVYNLHHKNLIEVGYPLIDNMIADYNKNYIRCTKPEKKKIVIAPSWQKDNIIETCIEELLDIILDDCFEIIVRPHPQMVRHNSEFFEILKEKYEEKGIIIQTDFSMHNSIMEADLVITDWSGAGYEYAYTTLKPVLFINTPMKVMNPEYKKIGIEPIDCSIRKRIGRSLDLNELRYSKDVALELINESEKYKKVISEVIEEEIYNVGKSAEVGALYIANQIKQKAQRRSQKL